MVMTLFTFTTELVSKCNWNTASRLINLGNSHLGKFSIHSEKVEFSSNPFNLSSHWIPAEITEHRCPAAGRRALLLSNVLTLRLIIWFTCIVVASLES